MLNVVMCDIVIDIWLQDCQPLRFGHNDYAFWALITPLCLSNPELTLRRQFSLYLLQ